MHGNGCDVAVKETGVVIEQAGVHAFSAQADPTTVDGVDRLFSDLADGHQGRSGIAAVRVVIRAPEVSGLEPAVRKATCSGSS